MGILRALSQFSNGGKIDGVYGIQSTQRDYSQYLVHFTAYSAMEPLRRAISGGINVHEIRKGLDSADKKSFETVKLIAVSKKLLSKVPYTTDGVYSIPFVCFSECTLPGFFSMAEQFGRFAFLFKKVDLFNSGARPCLYLEGSHYLEIKNNFQTSQSKISAELFHLANVYKPSRPGIQDYTHEREWRIFSDVEFEKVLPAAIICPLSYFEESKKLFPGIPAIIPIDLLQDLGA